ncbi:hypothetical protein T492DRAFT_883170, partial [Pavlovales sp. CCMP2436]
MAKTSSSPCACAAGSDYACEMGRTIAGRPGPARRAWALPVSVDIARKGGRKMYALMGVSPMEAAARIKKQLIDTIGTIAARGH